MRLPRLALTAAVAATVLGLSACAGGDLSSGTDSSSGGSGSSSSGSQGPVTISGQSFPEAALVAEMYSQVLASKGFDPTVKLVDTRDAYMGSFPGSIDVVPEYVGGIVDFLNTTENGAKAKPLTTSDAAASIKAAQSLLDQKGITLLTPSQATDTNAFFVTKQYAQDNSLSTLSDLEGKSVVLAAAPDCEGRTDCAGGLEKSYGIDITKILPLGYASDQTYKSVLDGESQLGETSTTDGTLDSQGLQLLDDDQQIQPAQNLVPAVSSDFLKQHPDVEQPLDDLMAALTTENLTQLNAKVSVDRQEPADVAKEFLQQQGLIS